MKARSLGQVLIVAATERELVPVKSSHTLACGIGPVEAAATTARALAELRPSVVLHVGIAGARDLPPLALVLGSEAIYCDAEGPLVPTRALPDQALLERLRDAFPGARVQPIGTSARVGGSHGVDVEAINLEVRGRSLVITGERPVRETEGRTYQQVELPSGPFRRVVELQIDVRADEAQASYEDGILRVELPVRLPDAARQVPIERTTEEQ